LLPVSLSETGAELLFELISQRYERGGTMITSNLPFDEWQKPSPLAKPHAKST
jgi:DNA replication protein DnaC